jgi:holin-like protein
MLGHLTILLVFQLLGETIARALDAPVPGPVIGMALLFAALALRGGPSDGMQKTVRGLLDHLSLLFVPAGVGVTLHLSLVRTEWLAITASLIVSTVVTIAVTAWVMILMERLRGEPIGPAIGTRDPGAASDKDDGHAW